MIVITILAVMITDHLTYCLQGDLEFTDDHVQPMKEYEYRVLAENEGGESEPSEISSKIKAKPLRGQ